MFDFGWRRLISFDDFVRNQHILGESPQPCLDPPSQNSTMVKAGLMRGGNVLGEIQPSERCYELTFVFRRATRLCE